MSNALPGWLLWWASSYVLVLLGPVIGPQEAENRSVQTGGKPTSFTLSTQAPSAKRRIGYSRRTNLPIMSHASAEVKPLDEVSRAAYGFFPIHPDAGGPVAFALLWPENENAISPDRIYIDGNRNGDLSDDGDGSPISSRFIKKQEAFYGYHGSLQLPLIYEGEVQTHLYSISLWCSKAGKVSSLRFSRSSWLEGTGTISGKAVRVALFDDDNDGHFDLKSGDSWALGPASLPAKTFLSSDRSRSVKNLQRMDNEGVRITRIFGHGTGLTLENGHPPPKAATKAVPFATEKKRTRSKTTVTWLLNESKGMQEAASRKKPVLLYFHSFEDGPSLVLDGRTFWDQEVVELCKKTICIRVESTSKSKVAQEKGVTKIPTLLLLSPAGMEVGRKTGYVPAEDFARFLQDGLRQTK